MDGQCQPSIRARSCLVQVAFFQSLGRAAEAGTERELLVGISQISEQAADLIGPGVCGPDDTQRSGQLVRPALTLLKRRTRTPGSIGAIGINPAMAAVERGARLGQARQGG